MTDSAIHSEPTIVGGETFAGRYRLEVLLGRGAFGAVYRARDPVLDRAIALKVIQGAAVAALGGAGRETFLAEARTIARLDHPNIVPVYDAGVNEGAPWMAMRLIHGEGLDAVLRREGGLEVTRAVALLRQAAAALAHAHRRGVVHRDVKPANMLVEKGEDGSERLWLGDFGISKVLSLEGATVGESRMLVGTPHYMSPEQAASKRVDGRSDLFSLGAVAFEMLTGSMAFRGDSIQSVLYAIVHGQPDFEVLRARVDEDLLAVVRKCLAKSPDDRWPRAEELIAALEGQRPAKTRLSTRAISMLQRRAATGDEWDGRTPVRIAGLTKRYGWGTPVLRGIDLEVPRGSVLALLGRNGCGKTTLLRTCLGIYRRDAGDLEVLGKDPELEGHLVNGRVGYVPEVPVYDERARVGDLLELSARLREKWDRSYCHRLLDRFDLDPAKRVRPLSRGEKSKLSFLLAMGHRPEVLFLDDPTLGLDAVVLDEILETLEEAVRQEGATVLIASHNYPDLEKVATHVGLLQAGRLAFSGALDELRLRVKEARVRFRDLVPDLAGLPGVKVLRSSGRDATIAVLEPASVDLLRAHAPESLELGELGLRDLVVAFLR
ncbi:MAG: protein kinase [Thermoanaerobaculia bacterium]|nr:protein kinase [Thermoanaerobaculia bacterium]